MHISSVKKIYLGFMFITKLFKLFLIYMLDFAMSSYLLFSISDFDIYCVILITKSENCAANDLAKKKNDYYYKGLYKTTCYKTNSIFFLSFSFLSGCFVSVFFFPYQSVCKFWKIDKIPSTSNLKILIEIFRQKRIASNVILVFLEHLKAKIFFVSQPWWPTYSSPSFWKSLDLPLVMLFASGDIPSKVVAIENSSIYTFLWR